MPLDATSYRRAVKIMRRRYSKRQWRDAKIKVCRWSPPSYASDRRAEMFSALGRLSLIRRHGPAPFERKLRDGDMALVRAANVFAPRVLP